LPALILALLCVGASAQAKTTFHSMKFDGVTRDYIVHLPPSWKPGGPALPVVLALHGGGGSATQMESGYGLDAYADRYGMIVVYPDGDAGLIGKLHTWNAGACCGRAKKENSDDSGFIAAVIDAVVRDYGASIRHVFVTGHSNGAMMAYRLACDIPEKIAAIAPVGGQSVYGCPHPKPVPVLHIHGTEDHCALYNGGPACGGCFTRAFGLPSSDGDTWPCDGVEKSLAARAAGYGCSAETTITKQAGPVSCASWKGCPAPGEVTLCRIEGGGHVWQGSRPPRFCKRNPAGRLCRNWTAEVGPILSGVDTDGLIFDFFAQQLKPQAKGGSLHGTEFNAR
jgi:polyhydroxybutyrate depolymerase